jgi:hypothetical protein
MIIRKLAMSRNARAGYQQQRPNRSRARLFTWLTLASGAAAGIAAMVATSLGFGLQTLAADVDAHRNTAPPSIGARTLSPPVQPVHKVVDVYDPPRVYNPPRSTNPESAPRTTAPRPPEDDGPPSGDD